MTTFRAVWPIVDQTVPYADLCREAMADLPLLAARAHARPTAQGKFVIAPSEIVPGSGRVTETCLVYTAPAAPVARTAFAALGRIGKEPTYSTPDHQACARCGRVRKVYRSVAKPRGDMCRDCMEVEAAA